MDHKQGELQGGSMDDRHNARSAPNMVSTRNSQSVPSSASASNLSSTARDQDRNHAWGIMVPAESGGLRPVVIDGSNVAMQLGKKVFATRGILICARYFISRGHQVITFVPQFRRSQRQDNFRRPMRDQHLLDWMYDRELLVYTPSRMMHEEDSRRRIVCYDDFNIVQYAHQTGGVIVSKDQYRDVLVEHPEWASTVMHRLIMFSWAGEMFMPAEDPFGRVGPRLGEVLRFGQNDRVAPLPVYWTVEQRQQLLRDIDEILAAPPPPPPPPPGTENGTIEHQGTTSMTDMLAISAAVPRYGFVRRDNSGNFGGFNHRSRRWMQPSVSVPSLAPSGFAPLQNGGWPDNDRDRGSLAAASRGEKRKGFVSFDLGPSENGESSSSNANNASSSSNGNSPFLEWFADVVVPSSSYQNWTGPVDPTPAVSTAQRASSISNSTAPASTNLTSPLTSPSDTAGAPTAVSPVSPDLTLPLPPSFNTPVDPTPLVSIESSDLPEEASTVVITEDSPSTSQGPSQLPTPTDEIDPGMVKIFFDIFPKDVVEKVLHEHKNMRNMELLSNMMADALLQQGM